MNKQLGIVTLLFVIALATQSCNQQTNETGQATKDTTAAHAEGPDYFNLRPEVEKLYSYSHAVKIGNDIKISGAVSMDDKGNLTAPGSMEQQMKNCYADLEKILQHYGYTFDDVIVENVFTTSMAEFINVSGYRNSIYKNNFQQVPGWR